MGKELNRDDLINKTLIVKIRLELVTMLLPDVLTNLSPFYIVRVVVPTNPFFLSRSSLSRHTRLPNRYRFQTRCWILHRSEKMELVKQRY